jgi:hypothetical protein
MNVKVLATSNWSIHFTNVFFIILCMNTYQLTNMNSAQKVHKIARSCISVSVADSLPHRLPSIRIFPAGPAIWWHSVYPALGSVCYDCCARTKPWPGDWSSCQTSGTFHIKSQSQRLLCWLQNFFSTCPVQHWGPLNIPSNDTDGSFLVVNWPEVQRDQLFTHSAMSYTTTHTYVFLAWHEINTRDMFTFQCMMGPVGTWGFCCYCY